MSGKSLIGFCAKQTRENTNLLSKWASLDNLNFDDDKNYLGINSTNVAPNVTLVYKEIPEGLLGIFLSRENFVGYDKRWDGNYMFNFSIIEKYVKDWSRICKSRK